MQRKFLIAAAAAATLLTATAANASRVNWSIGIGVPPVAAVVGAPAYYAPAYAPAYYPPAYYPPRVVYAPRPRIWLPPAPPLPRLFFGGGWRRGGWHGDHDGRVGWHR
jgi:hypothetical protein